MNNKKATILELKIAESPFRLAVSDVTEDESLEFPSLAPDESKFSPVGSLGNIIVRLAGGRRRAGKN